MISTYRIAIASLVILLVPACKIEIPVPVGGHVITESGSLDCAEQETCIVEVEDTNFDEVFTAQPSNGYSFAGWKRRDRGLFGGSTSSQVRISTALFAGNDLLLSILNSSQTFYLEPEFVSTIESLSVGSGHACAIFAGELTCWGDNSFGQSLPPVIDGPKAVSANTYNTCAIDRDGDIICWGAGSPRQIVEPPDLDASVDYLGAMSGAHFCATSNGSVYCWGDNSAGQVDVPELLQVQQLAVGEAHNCAIDAEGVKCWGGEVYLYNGVADVPPLKNPSQVAVAAFASCAIDDRGVNCWATRSGGINGIVDIPALSNPRKIVGGLFHFCALHDGGVECWPVKRGESLPQTTVPTLGAVSDIFASGNHSCALDIDGWRCWGALDSEKLDAPPLGESVCSIGEATSGDSEIECQRTSVLTNVPDDLDAVTAFAEGANSACLVDNNGLRCWGQGNGDDGFGAFPNGGQSVPPAGLSAATALYANFLNHCAKTADRIECWPRNNSLVSNAVSPHFLDAGWTEFCILDANGVSCEGPNIASVPNLVNPSAIAVGPGDDIDGDFTYAHHACAIDESGVVCWGANSSGQIDSPDVENPKMIGAGLAYSCALSEEVTCWGAISNVPELSNPYYLSVGDFLACALDDRGVTCWDGSGELQVPDEVKRRP